MFKRGDGCQKGRQGTYYTTAKCHIWPWAKKWQPSHFSNPHLDKNVYTAGDTQKFAMISCYRTLHSPIRTFPHSPQLKLLFRTALRSEKLNCTLHSTEFLAPLASSPHRKNVNCGQQVACADLKMQECYAIKN